MLEEENLGGKGWSEISSELDFLQQVLQELKRISREMSRLSCGYQGLVFENACEQLSVPGQAVKGLTGKKVCPLKKKREYRTKTFKKKSVSEKESHEDVLVRS